MLGIMEQLRYNSLVSDHGVGGTGRGFVANFAQKVIPGQLPLSVRRLRGERVELFGRSEALFPSLNYHRHCQVVDPTACPMRYSLR